MSVEVITYGKVTWVNIEKPTLEDMEYLRENYNFHPLDLEDCLSPIERPKIDEYEDYLFIVMHFPIYNRDEQVSQPSEVDFFIGARYLITVHEGILKPMARLFDECQQDEEKRHKFMAKGAARLLYAILDYLVDYIMPILNKVSSNIRQIERDMFTEDMRHIVREISIVRRDIIALRRIVKPQIAIVSNLEHRDRAFIQEELDVYFGDIADAFSKAWDTLEDHEDIIEALSDTSDSLTSYRINEVMRILTVISVIMLPLTLISGIYGMNLYHLPLGRDPWGFLYVIAFMVLTAVGMLLYFRHRGWL
jgi:magnesium transporter